MKASNKSLSHAMFYLTLFTGVQKAEFKAVDENDQNKGWNVYINGGKITFQISAYDKPEDICFKYLDASRYFNPYDLVVRDCLEIAVDTSNNYSSGRKLNPSKEELDEWFEQLQFNDYMFSSTQEICDEFVAEKKKEIV